MNHNVNEAIRFEQVSKSFDSSPLLENVSFAVARGEAICILGRSGTGKTVLLKLLVGMLKPDRGKIFINREEITALDMPGLLRVRKTAGFVFQHAALLDSISVADNVAFWLRRHSGKTEDQIREMVHQILSQVDLEEYADKMPSDLSAGLRKRVGLARALVVHPDILLIDDLSCGIDSFTALRSDSMLFDLKRNRKTTLVIVSDGMAGVRPICDRFGILEDGRMIFCGSADELERSDNRLVRQFLSGKDS